MRFKRILLPVDGSPESLSAARYALSHAGGDQTEYVLAHVYDPVPRTIGGEHLERLGQEISTEEDAVMAPYRALFREAGLLFRERLEEGHPAPVIVRLAAEEGCDLILMGTRALSDLSGLLLGSVSHQVVHEAPCPVLLVR